MGTHLGHVHPMGVHPPSPGTPHLPLRQQQAACMAPAPHGTAPPRGSLHKAWAHRPPRGTPNPSCTPFPAAGCRHANLTPPVCSPSSRRLLHPRQPRHHLQPPVPLVLGVPGAPRHGEHGEGMGHLGGGLLCSWGPCSEASRSPGCQVGCASRREPGGAGRLPEAAPGAGSTDRLLLPGMGARRGAGD